MRTQKKHTVESIKKAYVGGKISRRTAKLRTEGGTSRRGQCRVAKRSGVWLDSGQARSKQSTIT